jgi:hypothetical protein
VTFNLRFGEDRDGLKAKLIAAAKDNGRSLNQEILARLARVGRAVPALDEHGRRLRAEAVDAA